MERILEFRLSGEAAFFKIPQLNAYRYLSYSSIHKIALLGLLGSILGLEGYSSQEGEYPQFYEKLHGMKVSIEIEEARNIRKKVQQFNNSVGYASQEKGNNLIISEQWLEKPSWLIRILVKSVPKDLPLVDYLIDQKAIFIPYLGKNDHFASISRVNIKEGKQVTDFEKPINISGLFEEENFDIRLKRRVPFYKFSEALPIELDHHFNQYRTKQLAQTSGILLLKEGISLSNDSIYTIENQNYYFI